MKKMILLLTLLTLGQAFAADKKISELPIGVAASSGANDCFPYVDKTSFSTKCLKLSDILNIPTIVSTYAPKASPTFTGTLNASTIVAANNVNAAAFVDISANPSTTGFLRMVNSDRLNWRNAANSANLGFYLSGTNLFTFDAGLSVTGAGAFSGAVSGTTGTFSGAVSGSTGTFSAAVTGAGLNNTSATASRLASWDASKNLVSVSNLNAATNTISATNTNGNIVLTPNGTGGLAVGVTSPAVQGTVSQTIKNQIFGALRVGGGANSPDDDGLINLSQYGFLSTDSFASYTVLGANLATRNVSSATQLYTPVSHGSIGVQGLVLRPGGNIDIYNETGVDTAGATVTPSSRFTMTNVGLTTWNPRSLASAGMAINGGTTASNTSSSLQLTNGASGGGSYFMAVTDSGWGIGGNKLLLGGGTSPASSVSYLTLSPGLAQLEYQGGDVLLNFQSASNYVGRKASGDLWTNVAGGQANILGIAGNERFKAEATGTTFNGNTTSDTGLGTIASAKMASGYYEGSFTATFTSNATTSFTVTQAPTVKYVKFGSLVTLYIPSIGATCGTAVASLSSDAMPANLRPATSSHERPVFVKNNAAVQNTPGDLEITSGGILRFYPQAGSGGNFTSGATCGWQPTMVNYIQN